MRKTTSFLILLYLVFGISCEEDHPLTHFSIAGENYLEITIDGEKYNNEGSLVASGRSSGITCDNKSGALVFIGEISNPEFYFDLYVKHYYNLVDFKTAEIGTFKVGDNMSPLCNFDAFAEFQDHNESVVFTHIKSEGINKITKIYETNIPAADESLYGIKGKKYGVEGEFSSAFINQSGKIIEVSGKYEAFIYFLN